MKNLEIKKLIIIILMQALCLSACKIQQPGYVGLFMDNERTDLESLTDDTVSVVPSDSVKALEKLIPAYQKQTLPPTDTVYSEKVNVKSEYLNVYENVVLQDSVKVLNRPKTVSSDTAYVKIEIIKEVPAQPKTNDTTIANSPAQSDSIRLLKKQIDDLQKQQPTPNDTEFTEKEAVETVSQRNKTADKETTARLDAQSDSIRLLKKQIDDLQKQQPTPNDTEFTEREPVKTVSQRNKTADKETIARLDAQSDSIRSLKKQIDNLQKQRPILTDTVLTEKEVVKTVPEINKTADEETSAIISAQNDSTQLLKKQISEIQSLNLVIPDTMVTEKNVIKEVPHTNQEVSRPDTITLVAYYEMGKLIPIAADSIVNELKAIVSTRDVLKINIAGHTDISGDSITNNLITNKRISYFSERLTDFYNIEKIFHQNFGDTFASNTVLDSERRIVITLILQNHLDF